MKARQYIQKEIVVGTLELHWMGLKLAPTVHASRPVLYQLSS